MYSRVNAAAVCIWYPPHARTTSECWFIAFLIRRLGVLEPQRVERI